MWNFHNELQDSAELTASHVGSLWVDHGEMTLTDRSEVLVFHSTLRQTKSPHNESQTVDLHMDKMFWTSSCFHIAFLLFIHVQLVKAEQWLRITSGQVGKGFNLWYEIFPDFLVLQLTVYELLRTFWSFYLLYLHLLRSNHTSFTLWRVQSN